DERVFHDEDDAVGGLLLALIRILPEATDDPQRIGNLAEISPGIGGGEIVVAKILLAAQALGVTIAELPVTTPCFQERRHTVNPSPTLVQAAIGLQQRLRRNFVKAGKERDVH